MLTLSDPTVRSVAERALFCASAAPFAELQSIWPTSSTRFFALAS